jgi:hypothetical protein
VKRTKRTASLAADGPWVPIDTALTRGAAAEHTGAVDLALHDIVARLRSGDMCGMRRGFLRWCRQGTRWEEVKPPHHEQHIEPKEFWQRLQFTIFNNRVRCWSEDDEFRGGQWVIYVHGEDLDKLWPTALAAASTAIPTDDPLKPPQRRRGPVVTHDWFSICGEIARRCIDPKTARVRVPNKGSSLVRDMLEWCEEQGWAKPARSEMSEAVRRVCEALRAAQK